MAAKTSDMAERAWNALTDTDRAVLAEWFRGGTVSGDKLDDALDRLSTTTPSAPSPTRREGRTMDETRTVGMDLGRTGEPRTPSREQVQDTIDTELKRAYTKHGRERWSRHEFYAILLEEVDELWDAIKRDGPSSDVYAEVIEVAAMCFRFLETSASSDVLYHVNREKHEKLRLLGGNDV